MPWELLHIPLMLPAFALVLARLGGLMIAAPIFSGAAIPRRVKGAFTIGMAWVIFPLVAGQVPQDVSVSTVVTGMVGELMIGLSIGLALATLISGVQLGGMVAAQQAGIALGQSFDPTVDESSTVIGQAYSIFIYMVFLVVGGHRALVAALLDTFLIIPPLSFQFNDSLLELLVEMLTGAFVMAVRLAGPVLIALVLLTLAMGLISRTMPQLNILSVGFTLKALVMLAVAGLAMVAAQEVVLEMTFAGLDRIREVFGLPA